MKAPKTFLIEEAGLDRAVVERDVEQRLRAQLEEITSRGANASLLRRFRLRRYQNRRGQLDRRVTTSTIRRIVVDFLSDRRWNPHPRSGTRTDRRIQKVVESAFRTAGSPGKERALAWVREESLRRCRVASRARAPREQGATLPNEPEILWASLTVLTVSRRGLDVRLPPGVWIPSSPAEALITPAGDIDSTEADRYVTKGESARNGAHSPGRPITRAHRNLVVSIVRSKPELAGRYDAIARRVRRLGIPIKYETVRRILDRELGT